MLKEPLLDERKQTRTTCLQWVVVWTCGVAKTVNATGRRCLVPYIPFLAAFVGCDAGTLLTVLALGNLVSIFSPFAVPALAAVMKPRTLVVGSLLLATVAQAVLGIASLPMFVVGTLGLGFTAGVLFPACVSFFAEYVSAERRAGLWILCELSWGAASFIGLPTVGLLFSVRPWAPFVMLAAISLAVAVAYVLRLQAAILRAHGQCGVAMCACARA